MPILDIEDNQLTLSASDRLTDLIRALPGWRYDYKAAIWKAPLSPLTVDACWSTFKSHLETTDAIFQYMSVTYAANAYLSSVVVGLEKLEIPDELIEGLWGPQVAGVNFLAIAQHAYLCDEMGAGKTAQVLRGLRLANIRKGNSYPALVVCNKSAMLNWPEEAASWDPKVAVFVATGTKAAKEKVIAEAAAFDGDAILVINWESLEKHSRLAPYPGLAMTDKEKEPGSLNKIPFRSVIADEAHKAKGHKSKRTRALWQIAHQPQVVNRWAVTGTPLTGEYEDLWALGHFVDPAAFPARTKFMQRYTIQTVNYHGGLITHGWNPEHEEELMRHFKARFLRRTKRDMRGDDYKGKLPSITRLVPMEGKQGTTYRKFKKDSLADIDGQVLASTSALDLRIRLNQFAAGTPVIEEVDGFMKVVALQKPSNKVDALLDILSESGSEQVVVFAESRLLIDLCAKELDKGKITYGQITGSQSTFERQAAINSFASNELRVMLCTYAAGSESINLNSAHILVRLQWTDNFVHWQQAPDRLDRGTQDKYVQIIDVVSQDSAEYKIHQNIDAKGQIAQTILDDPEFLLK